MILTLTRKLLLKNSDNFTTVKMTVFLVVNTYILKRVIILQLFTCESASNSVQKLNSRED